MKTLFVYGSLKNDFYRFLLFERKIEKRIAVLNGYSLVSNGGYPWIIKDKNKKVDGYLIDLTEKELMIADLWEETPNSYKRIKVKVNQQKVFVYVLGKNKPNSYFTNNEEIIEEILFFKKNNLV